MVCRRFQCAPGLLAMLSGPGLVQSRWPGQKGEALVKQSCECAVRGCEKESIEPGVISWAHYGRVSVAGSKPMRNWMARSREGNPMAEVRNPKEVRMENERNP